MFTHPTAGTVEVRVNGVTLVSLSGINTQPGFHNYHNTVGVYIYRIGGFDDYYICDSTGLLMNDFQGACRVIGLLPNADTGTEQWTPSTGTAHYACVDENPPNAASDYVSSSTQAQMDLYAYPSLVGTGAGAILGIQVSTQIILASGACNVIESPIVSNGITDLGTDTVNNLAVYTDTRHISMTDPSTGLPWTAANLAAAQIGIKIM